MGTNPREASGPAGPSSASLAVQSLWRPGSSAAASDCLQNTPLCVGGNLKASENFSFLFEPTVLFPVNH